MFALFIRIEPDWNVKFSYSYSDFLLFSIRIEPDWNVKVIGSGFVTDVMFLIRIEPDWNVKHIAAVEQKAVEELE